MLFLFFNETTNLFFIFRPRLRRRIQLVLAEKGTCFSLWSDVVDNLSRYEYSRQTVLMIDKSINRIIWVDTSLGARPSTWCAFREITWGGSGWASTARRRRRSSWGVWGEFFCPLDHSFILGTIYQSRWCAHGWTVVYLLMFNSF